MNVNSITPSEVFALNKKSPGISIIDVRELDEFAEVSSPLCKNIPLSGFQASDFLKNGHKSNPVYIICRSGKRSFTAAQALVAAGFESVYNIEGGMIAWEASGLPVKRR